MNDIFVQTRLLLPTLPKNEKQSAQLLLDVGAAVTEYTLAEFAEEADCSEASVLRFCKRIGLSGFAELKHSLALHGVGDAEYENYDVEGGDSLRQILQKVFWHNQQALRNTLVLYSEEYDKALDALSKARSVHFFGVGDANFVCKFGNMKFNHLGMLGSAYSDAVMQLGVAALLGKGDIAFAISYSGKTKSVVESMRLARENGATTICITKTGKSPLTKYCDIIIFAAATDNHSDDKKIQDIVGRRVAEQAIIEALYLALLECRRPELKENVEKSVAALQLNKNARIRRDQ